MGNFCKESLLQLESICIMVLTLKSLVLLCLYYPKDAYRMANTVEADQTALIGAV